MSAVPDNVKDLNKAWRDKFRAEAKKLADELDSGYMRLAEILYDVWNLPIDGDPAKNPIFMDWGYSTFEEYAAAELKLEERKAQYLRTIWHRLTVDLKDMDPVLKQQIIKLGYSKVRYLVSVLTLNNAKQWLLVGQQSNTVELQYAIRNYRQAAKAGKQADTPVTLDEVPIVFTPLRSKTFQLHEEQFEIVDAAEKRASQIAHSEKAGHLLTLICMDFLATNDFHAGDKADKMKFLAKYESILGYKLVAVDPTDGEVVYGISTLEGLADDHKGES